MTNIEKLNADIKKFPQVFPATSEMTKTFEGVQRLIMLDRYAFKDTKKETLSEGDIVVFTIKQDPNFPARAIGKVISIFEGKVVIDVEEQYEQYLELELEREHGVVAVQLAYVDKPLELYYEQIAKRNAKGLASVESEGKREEVEKAFYEQLSELKFVPAGRVLYGAGAEIDVTFFNCYVMPMPKDSREGIGQHRNEVMEIMSRGGGVGTNGSTLRPRNALARGVNGKSSGSVSWLNDIAQLTHLVEQGGSRRGAQMIMLNVWHPDILEFIISKVQNPNILRKLIAETEDEEIRKLAQNKLKFTPLSEVEKLTLASAKSEYETFESSHEVVTQARQKLKDGGTYSVHIPDFLSGANISVGITDDFMQAVEIDAEFDLQFPDIENYSEYDMALYDDHWNEIGDVREWAKRGAAIKTYRTIKARALWDLINLCATYSAEPGIFFIDAANNATNAQAYGQQVVCTNPLVNVSGRI